MKVFSLIGALLASAVFCGSGHGALLLSTYLSDSSTASVLANRWSATYGTVVDSQSAVAVNSVTSNLGPGWANPVAGTWMNAKPDAAGSGVSDVGFYTFTQTFDPGNQLTTTDGEAIVSSSGFSFQVAGDDVMEVWLNGSLLSGGIVFTPLTTITGFSVLDNVTNTLVLKVKNNNLWGGAILTNVQGSYEAEVPVDVVPEPASIAVFAGLAGLMIVRRKRR
jgi:hypothetical protein